MSELAADVKRVIEGGFNIPPHILLDGAKLREELGFDSLDMVELAIDLEEKLGIELDDEAMENARTVGDVVQIVRELKEGK